ncbi:hypothetical protein UFOVP103_28 [uncultured Caudovirales phage]|uniref:Uncharacterized protein n=1 Tax=uncultured Caudovirales phage TaxID=2100421 RepID=A0A6J5L4V0_9CAUD|nr:hypothetical protein UFOVP103_28 [uncultured Caudovirales phage]CAB5216960.1 hypothetical protein UFOVP197_27 [uncultured Caudovirales phage]
MLKRLLEKKKITNDDYIEIMLIEPESDSYDGYSECREKVYCQMCYRVMDGILKRLVRMAEAIENETNEIKKKRMIEIYDTTEKEYERWKNSSHID